MLNTSSDLLLIVLAICSLALAGFVCHLVYHLTLLIKESQKTVTDINKKLEKIDPVLNSTVETVTALTQTIKTLNENLLRPIASFTEIFKSLKNIAGIFKKK